jgi:hypothetical protein
LPVHVNFSCILSLIQKEMVARIKPMNRKTGMESQAPLCVDSTCGLQYGSVIRCVLHY